MLDTMLANRTVAVLCLAAAVALGWVLRMVFDVSVALYRDWRDKRQERKAQPEVKAWQEYLSTDTDPNLTRQRYNEESRRTLSGDWRELVDEVAPQSPEVVTGSLHLEDTYQFNVPTRTQSARSHTAWTEVDRKTPGRHRAPEDDNSLSWRREYTGEWEKVNTNQEELVSA